jgi:hypothetical protein
MPEGPPTEFLLAIGATRNLAHQCLRAAEIIVRKAHLPEGARPSVEALELLADCARVYLLNRDIYDSALFRCAKGAIVELGGVTAISAAHWAISYGLHLVKVFAEHSNVTLIREGGLPKRTRQKLEKAWPQLRVLLKSWHRPAEGKIGPAILLETQEGVEVYGPVKPPNLSDLRRLQAQVELEFARVLHEAASVPPTPALGETPAKLPRPALEIKDGMVYRNGNAVALGMTNYRAGLAVTFLRELLKEPGNWKSSRDIALATKTEGTRYDRIYKDLPIAIKSYIESNRRKGYRVRSR